MTDTTDREIVTSRLINAPRLDRLEAQLARMT